MKIMKPLLLSLALCFTAGSLLIPETTQAAPKKSKTASSKSKTMYRWVDAEGKVQYSDTLPAQAVQQGHQELNKRGTTTQIVEKAKTPEERLLEDKKLEEQKEQEKEIKNAQQVYASYSNEEAIRQDYNKQRAVYQAKIQILEIDVKNRRQALVQVLIKAADQELKNGKATKKQERDVQKAKERLDSKRKEIDEANEVIQKINSDEQITLIMWKAGNPNLSP